VRTQPTAALSAPVAKRRDTSKGLGRTVGVSQRRGQSHYFTPETVGVGSNPWLAGRGIGARKYNRNTLDGLGAMPSVSVSEAMTPETPKPK